MPIESEDPVPLRDVLLGLLRSDVIHVWPAEQVVDYYLLPLVHEAIEHHARARAQEFVADLTDGLRQDRVAYGDRPSHAELERRRYLEGRGEPPDRPRTEKA